MGEGAADITGANECNFLASHEKTVLPLGLYSGIVAALRRIAVDNNPIKGQNKGFL